MFENTTPAPSGRLWKIVPAGAAVAVVLAVGAFYLTRAGSDAAPDLTGVVRQGEVEFEESMDSVSLHDRGIKMLKSFTGSRLVMFAGAVSNRHDRALDIVEVRLILFNESEAVFETTRTPILPGPYTPPVRSGETRAFTVYLEDFPEHWWASRAEMEISGIRFEGD